MIHNPLRKSHLKAAAVVSVGAFSAITCSTTAAVAADGPHGWHRPHYIEHREKIETQIRTKSVFVSKYRKTPVKVDVWCPTHWDATGGGYSVAPNLLFMNLSPMLALGGQEEVEGVISENRPTPAPYREAKDWKVVYTPGEDHDQEGTIKAWVVCVHEAK